MEMTVGDLVAELLKLKQDRKIMILDGHNAGGYPRTINFGPARYIIKKSDIEACGDCEERQGEHIYVIGYGCY